MRRLYTLFCWKKIWWLIAVATNSCDPLNSKLATSDSTSVNCSTVKVFLFVSCIRVICTRAEHSKKEQRRKNFRLAHCDCFFRVASTAIITLTISVAVVTRIATCSFFAEVLMVFSIFFLQKCTIPFTTIGLTLDVLVMSNESAERSIFPNGKTLSATMRTIFVIEVRHQNHRH